MTDHRVYIAYIPSGAGLMCAVVYIEVEQDIYGWWIGYKDASFPSAFFKLEDFYSTKQTIFYATEGSDIYGGWKYDFSVKAIRIDKPVPVEDEMCHVLDRLQEEFIAEWLFFSIDTGIEEELAFYRQHELPVHEVNIKHKKLNKLKKDEVVWTYASKEAEMNVIDYMAARWSLEYGRD